jgi:hypothetical protein
MLGYAYKNNSADFLPRINRVRADPDVQCGANHGSSDAELVAFGVLHDDVAEVVAVPLRSAGAGCWSGRAPRPQPLPWPAWGWLGSALPCPP